MIDREEAKIKEELAAYLDQKHLEYANKKGRVVSANEWAVFLGVSNTSLSQWRNKVRLPTGDNIFRLGMKFGPDFYEILGIPPMLPEDPLVKRAVKMILEMNKAQRKEFEEHLDSLAPVLGYAEVEA